MSKQQKQNVTPAVNDDDSASEVSNGSSYNEDDDIGTTAPLTDALAPFFEVISKDGKEVNIAEVIFNNGRISAQAVREVGGDIVASINNLTSEVAKLVTEVKKNRKDPKK